MATVVNMHEGEEILIASHGKSVTPIREKRKTIPWDLFQGRLAMADDFDAPLEEMQS